MWRNSSADTKVTEEGGWGSDTGTRAHIPLQPMDKTMMKQAVPLEPTEVHVEQVSTLWATKDPLLEQVDALKKAAVHGKPIQEQAPGRQCGPMKQNPQKNRFSGRLRDPKEDPHWSNLFLKDYTTQKEPMPDQYLIFYILDSSSAYEMPRI